LIPFFDGKKPWCFFNHATRYQPSAGVCPSDMFVHDASIILVFRIQETLCRQIPMEPTSRGVKYGEEVGKCAISTEIAVYRNDLQNR